MVEPAGSNRHVALGGDPMCAGPIAAVQSFGTIDRRAGAGCELRGVQRGPAGLARDAAFVPDPTHVWTGIAEHAGVRLQVANDLPGLWPVVIGASIDLPF